MSHALPMPPTMTTNDACNVPEEFLKLLNESMARKGYSLRALAREAKMSPAHLSRIMNKERNLPDDEKILEIARALDIQPPELMLIEAGRTPEEIQAQLRNPQVPLLLQTVAALSEQDLKKVMKSAQALRLKYLRKKAAK